MPSAVCFQCGRPKSEPLGPCVRGHSPSTSPERIESIALSDAHLAPGTLTLYGSMIAAKEAWQSLPSARRLLKHIEIADLDTAQVPAAVPNVESEKTHGILAHTRSSKLKRLA